MTKHPPRISFKVAMEARIAVVFRKGPTRHVQMLLWNLGTDDVNAGQWLIGNVEDYNISPDGQLVVYSARKAGKCFTAVSRPPYFTALAFWPDGWPPTNGGFFLGSRHLILGAKHAKTDVRGSVPKNFEIGDVWTYFFNGRPFTGWDSIVRPREALGGWMDERPHSRKPNPVDATVALEREWASKRGPTFRLLRKTDREALAGLECADWDDDGSLLFARAGGLYRQKVLVETGAPTLITDLSDNTFEEVIAPEELRTWPSSKVRRP